MMDASAYFILGLVVGFSLSVLAVVVLYMAAKQAQVKPPDELDQVNWKITGDDW